MSTNNRNIENKGDFNQDKNVSGRPEGTDRGPIAGGADNTRGENKKSAEGSSGGAKKGKDTPQKDSPQGSNANLTTTSRGADSTDKEFRNNQPNASTLKGHKSSSGLGNEKH
ncbi:hypothetical protein [Pontibacter cellulosilyticus]|uniref:Uncharacterized protein n=1 Tax=Pontibacter cellulosilyticus TaxID=1720253 RepID=A0A923N588_9BACT|nr:hypothetical protein [Pontibacter cellulosilyticus]MBC5991977.1 hypothetical protein [Pontibacter cellulosilyticus]